MEHVWIDERKKSVEDTGQKEERILLKIKTDQWKKDQDEEEKMKKSKPKSKGVQNWVDEERKPKQKQDETFEMEVDDRINNEANTQRMHARINRNLLADYEQFENEEVKQKAREERQENESEMENSQERKIEKVVVKKIKDVWVMQESGSQEDGMEDSSDDEEVNENVCIECKAVYTDDEQWVGCDFCTRWLHVRCSELYGLTEAEIDATSYKCRYCQRKQLQYPH